MKKEFVTTCDGVKKNTEITELVFILDKSGSMSGMEQDTIGGFNSMIEKQKKIDGKVYVSTVLFSNVSKVLHDRVPLEEIQPLTEEDYRVYGSTALLDALGGAIRHIGNVHKYARKEDVPTRTLFVITTDGMENASRIFHIDQVKSMIRRQEEKYGWEFLFLASNIDAVKTAERIGVRKDRAVNYTVEEETPFAFDAISMCISEYRTNATMPNGKNIEKQIKIRRNKQSK